jgi:hypothetical protein
MRICLRQTLGADIAKQPSVTFVVCACATRRDTVRLLGRKKRL